MGTTPSADDWTRRVRRKADFKMGHEARRRGRNLAMRQRLLDKLMAQNRQMKTTKPLIAIGTAETSSVVMFSETTATTLSRPTSCLLGRVSNKNQPKLRRWRVDTMPARNKDNEKMMRGKQIGC